MAEKRDLSNIPYLAVGAVVALEEEIEKAAERLVEKGKSLTPEGRKKMATAKKGLISKGDDFSQVVARTVQRALENTGIVTRADLESIEGRVSHIEKKVATMKKSPKPAAKKPAAKKPAAKKPAAKKPAKKKTAKKPAAKKPAERMVIPEVAPPPPAPVIAPSAPPAEAPEATRVISDLIPRRPAE
jgi:polyhydroxyalkanoate synthesis regulator phasin